LHSLSAGALQKKGFKKTIMSFSTYKKTINDIKAYNRKIKALIFAGHGEPLLHKDICEMVYYAKKNDIAERVEITTNGSLLNKKMVDGLIDAGLDRIKISIQGTTAQKYRDVAGYDLDYVGFLSNLRYFHQNKKHTEVYIKIIDLALDGQDDADRFRVMFQPVADEVNIEYAIPFVKELNTRDKEFERCKQGHRRSSDICAMPFYMQVVAPNGDVLPCCSTDIPVVLGNIENESLKEIWNSKTQYDFLKTMLSHRSANPVCKICCVPQLGLQNGDYLDDYRDELSVLYTKRETFAHYESPD
jgi:radical SAM protein with 4Fe4S-binding SPASM domain